MKNVVLHYFVFLIVIFYASLSLAQTNPHELVIPDYYESGKYIEDTILNDGGKNPDRVYILKRGGNYYLSAKIQNQGWILRIKAEDGSGPKPVIYCSPKSSTVPKPMFEALDDIYMTDIAIVGYPEYNPVRFSMMTNNIINVNTDKGIIVSVDYCIFSSTTNAHIQTTRAARIVKVTNSIFTNVGSIALNNFGNGRGIDLRNVSCDSLIVVNNTFINLQDRAVRHYVTSNETGFRAIEHFIFDHNTVTNSMGCHGTIFLSYIGKSSVITNNLFVDNMALGSDTDAVRQKTYFESHGELNEFGKPSFPMIYSFPNDTTNWTVKNNYYAVTPALKAWYDSVSSIEPGFKGLPSPLTQHINKKLGADSLNAFIKDTITDNFFAKNTNTPIAMADWYRKPVSEGGAGKQKIRDGFSSATDLDRRTWSFFADTLNLSYSKTSQAYSGSINGMPVGSLTWWNSLVGVEETNNYPPGNFKLEQNYPNPFNPKTVITYAVPQDSAVKLEVFDVLGRNIATLIDTEIKAGKYSIDFDGSKLSSGIYIYRLYTPYYISCNKMLLLK